MWPRIKKTIITAFKNVVFLLVTYRLGCWGQLPSRPVSNQFWQDLIQIKCFKFYSNQSTLYIVVLNSWKNTSTYIVEADLGIYMSRNYRCSFLYTLEHMSVYSKSFKCVIPFIYLHLLGPAEFFLQYRVLTLFSNTKLNVYIS